MSHRKNPLHTLVSPPPPDFPSHLVSHLLQFHSRFRPVPHRRSPGGIRASGDWPVCAQLPLSKRSAQE